MRSVREEVKLLVMAPIASIALVELSVTDSADETFSFSCPEQQNSGTLFLDRDLAVCLNMKVVKKR